MKMSQVSIIIISHFYIKTLMKTRKTKVKLLFVYELMETFMMMEKSILCFSDLDFFLILIWCLYNIISVISMCGKKRACKIYLFFLCVVKSILS